MVLVLGLVVPAAASAETKGWGAGTSRTPEMSDLTPSLSSGEAYSERYGWTADLDGGGQVAVNFTISNLGWGDASAAVKVKVRHPELDETYVHKKQVGQGDWSYAKKGFKLKLGNTQIKGSGKSTFHLRHDGKVKLRAKLTSEMPMWSPGRGKLTVGDGYYYKMDVVNLRGSLSGKIHIDGKWHEVKGTRTGYGDHVATNIAPYNLAKRFSRFRVYDDDNDVFAIWREIRLVEDYGGESVTFLVLGYKDKIVFSDPDASIKFGRTVKDSHTGYRLPYAVQVEGHSDGDAAKVVLKGTKVRRKNLLKGYGTIAKTVAQQMADPWNYYFNCKYALQMEIQGSKAKVEGKAGYVVDFVNK